MSSLPFARRWPVVIVAAAIASALALKFLTASFIAIFLIGAAVCAWLAREVHARVPKTAFGNAAVLLLALTVIETVLSIQHPAVKYVERGGPLMIADRDLGYAARPGASVTQKRYDGGRLTYDATYDIDAYGRRRLPPYNGSSRDAVLLFGCSLTFGDGVNDGDAFPARLQNALGDRARVISFALAGYGTHQVLRQLETHREADAVRGLHPIAVLYPAIPDHIHRAAGRSTWEVGGPHYEPDGSGDARYVGPFPAPSHKLDLVRRVLRKCQLWSVLTERRRWPTSRHDLDRFVAIVARADRIVRTRYGVPLVVVSFWAKHPEAARVAARLRERGVVVVPVERLIPDYDARQAVYDIPRDGHFNPTGNERFAEGVLAWITRATPPTPTPR